MLLDPSAARHVPPRAALRLSGRGTPSTPRAPRARLAAAALALLAACGGDTTTTPADPGTFVRPPVPSPTFPGRGDLVASTPGPRIGRQEMGATFAFTGLTGAFTPRFDAQSYVVRYRTPGVDGQLTTASGAVWFPVGATGPLPMVVYLHGTITSKTDAPSVFTSQEALFGAGYATDGSVAVLPDFLGLGVAGTDTYHPYLHLQTQSSASVDLMRAARTLAQQLGVTLDRRNLFVTGYSQGGGAAMGLVRELERNFATEFPVLAAAPMSGPYDLEGTARTIIETDPQYGPSVLYTAYLGEAMRRVYQLAPTTASYFVAPHDQTAAAIVEGRVTPTQLASLPPRPRALLQPALVQAIQANRDHPLWRALRDNDAYDWTPRTPLRMYYGGADRDVFPQNALTAQARMRANGAPNVAAVSVGATLDHGGAVLPATRAGKVFLDSVRRTLVP